MRINIIAWHNGGGLSRDVDILVGAIPTDRYEISLNGLPVSEAPVRRRRIYHRANNACRLLFQRSRLAAAPYDINLFLEDINPGFFRYARANAFIPNPEWFKPEQQRYLKNLDAVLCKTREAQDTFKALDCDTHFISFTSEDRRDNTGSIEKQTGFLHLAGRSWQKGTPALTDVWLKHPEWPVLRVVQSARTYEHSRVKPIEAPNIDHILERLDDDNLRALQNSHPIHLCPSEAEGFGHCIVEAMSCGALTLTTNAPPMNELITADRGILVDYSSSQSQRSGHNYYVDRAQLEERIGQIITMDEATRQQLGLNARTWFENNDREFRRLLSDALDVLGAKT